LTAELTIRPVSQAQATSATPLASRAPHVTKPADAAQKFEAFVLQSFIQEMMPETQESVFGGGISGDFWKSMMSEKIAEQVAARGSLGIANTVRAQHAMPALPSSGFNPLDVLDHASTLTGVSAQLDDAKPVSGE
jgi:Rod binding domain-containing protein